jgi:hypothetical protein
MRYCEAEGCEEPMDEFEYCDKHRPAIRHYAGPYGHDYYYIGKTLTAQPSLASGVFEPNEDECLPVADFVEPLTEAELAEAKAALA